MSNSFVLSIIDGVLWSTLMGIIGGIFSLVSSIFTVLLTNVQSNLFMTILFTSIVNSFLLGFFAGFLIAAIYMPIRNNVTIPRSIAIFFTLLFILLCLYVGYNVATIIIQNNGVYNLW